MFVSFVGTWIQSIAQSWLVFQLSHSAFLLGLVGFLGSLPIFLFTFVGGATADREDKRRILIFTQSAFMLLAFFLAAITYLQLVRTWHIMLIALLNGIVMAFDGPSRQAMVAELVDRSHLFNAILLNSAAFNLARTLGPALAALLVSYIGMGGCFLVNGLSFLVVIVALFSIRNSDIFFEKKNNFFYDVIEGLVFVYRHKIIFLFILITGITSLFGVSYVILMPIVAEEVLGFGMKGLGLLMSSAGLGAVVATVGMATMGYISNKVKILVLSCFSFAGLLVLFSLSKNFIFSLVILFFLGWTIVTTTSFINTLLQSIVPDEFRGRVMSAFMFSFAGVMPFGHLIAGVLAQAWGVSFALRISGFICLISFLFIFSRYRGILIFKEEDFYEEKCPAGSRFNNVT